MKWTGWCNKEFAFLRRFTIKKRLRVVFFVQLLLVIFWCWLAIYFTLKSTISHVQMNNSQIMATVTQSFSNTIASLKTVTMYPVVRTNQQVTDTYKYLARPNQYHKYMLDNDFKNNSVQLLNQHPDVFGIYLFDKHGTGSYINSGRKNLYTRSSSEFGLPTLGQREADWFVRTFSARGEEYIWSGESIGPLLPGENQVKNNFIFLSRSIFNTELFANVGVVLASADISGVQEIFENQRLLDKERMGIFLQDGTKLAGSLSTEEYLVTAAKLPALAGGMTSGTGYAESTLITYAVTSEGYVCVIQTPLWPVIGVSIRQQWSFFLLVLGLLVLTTAATNIIVASIRVPIARLAASCGQMRNRQQPFRFTDTSGDELSEFATSFNHLTSEIEQLIAEGYQKDIAMVNTEMQMLRQQINPHFLYNTLESIRAAARLKGEDELGEMAFLLAQTLRYGVLWEDGMVLLEREMQHLEDYIRLQKIRYQGTVQFHVLVDKALYTQNVIRLFLQPIVENALYHGINSRPQGGEITVLGFDDGEDLVFQIIDNGIGMEPAMLEDLNQYINGKNDKFRSIGLKNVNRRIQLFYGERYGVHIEAKAGRGTIVNVRMPKNAQKEVVLDASNSCSG